MLCNKLCFSPTPSPFTLFLLLFADQNVQSNKMYKIFSPCNNPCSVFAFPSFSGIFWKCKLVLWNFSITLSVHWKWLTSPGNNEKSSRTLSKPQINSFDFLNIFLEPNKLWREFQLFCFQFLLDFSSYKNNMKSYEHFPVEVISMQIDVIAMCWLKIANYPMLWEILWVYITSVILFVRRNCPSAEMETAQKKKKELLFYTQNWLGTQKKKKMDCKRSIW